MNDRLAIGTFDFLASDRIAHLQGFGTARTIKSHFIYYKNERSNRNSVVGWMSYLAQGMAMLFFAVGVQMTQDQGPLVGRAT